MNNILRSGMVFHNTKSLADFIGYTTSVAPTAVRQALSHYCTFHIDNHQVVIDEVFNIPKPFRNSFLYSKGQTIQSVTGEQYVIEDFYMKKYEENGKDRQRRVYVCRCLKDNYVFERTGSQIDKGVGCPMCNNKVAVLGYNTIFDLRPDLIQYLVNPGDAKKYTILSNKYIWCKCPYCGRTKRIIISNLSQLGFSCSYCSDGISFPNKFVRSFLSQLDIDFIPEKSFEWSSNRKYDQYLPDFNMIIENHGEQHYTDKGLWNNFRNQSEIDSYKKDLALNNGIKEYVELDCSESSLQFIKASIMSSCLPTILQFDADDIDWNKCLDDACNNMIHSAWDLWNQGMNYSQIAKKCGVSIGCAQAYISKGCTIGVCKAKEHPHCVKHINQNGNNGNSFFTVKPIFVIEDGIYFASSKICQQYYNELGYDVCYKSINRAAKNNTRYKGKSFKYISRRQFNAVKEQSLIDNRILVEGDLFDERYLEKEE